MSQAAQVPVWVTITASFGVGGFVGNLISTWLTSRAQRKNWLRDNKKQEWRELIAVLSQSVHRILQNTEDFRFEGIVTISGEQEKEQAKHLLEADLEARRVIEDRIFISSRVQSENVLERWRLIAAEKDIGRILEYWNHLHTALVDFAHKDLGIKS
jgi:hypothetical protein